VDDAEDRGVGADAQGERHDRGGREDRVAPQAPDAVPEILEERLDDGRSRLVEARLLVLLDAAEGEERLPARLLGRQAALDQLARLHVEVEAHLFVHLFLDRAPPPERLQGRQHS
jgi:hypothetical protein